MAEIINLNRARKQRRRTDKQKTAAANRTRFGRTKEERVLSLDNARREKDALDGARLDKDAGDADDDAPHKS